MTRTDTIVQAAVGAALLACAVGAVDSAARIAADGLFAVRPPLSVPETAVRCAGALGAAGLLVVRRDTLERLALVCAAVGIGSSALFGLGLRSDTLSAVRLVFHLLAYALGVVVLVRTLAVLRRRPRTTGSPR